MGRKGRLFAPIGIWEVKKMFDKVAIIQKWYRNIIRKRKAKALFLVHVKAARAI